MKSQIEIYQGSDGQTQIEVRFEGDTFWLPLQQISDSFQRDQSVISRHIKNIYGKVSWPRKQLLQKMQQFKWKEEERSREKLNFITWMLFYQ